MSTTNITISFEGLLGNPVVADDYHPSMQRLARLINKLASTGTNSATPGTVTMSTSGSAVFATGTVTFSGAATAADTVTIAGTALTATQKNATGTAAFSTVVAGNTVTIAGVTFTGSNTPTTELLFDTSSTDAAAATSLATKVTAYPGVNAIVTATAASSTVTFRAVATGTGGNAITLAKVGSPIAISGAVLSGGAAAANNAFDPGNTATTAAVAFVAAVNASTTQAVVGNVVASNVAGVVTLKGRVPGPGGNVTLTKSGTNIAVSGVALTGGSLGTAVVYTF